MASLVFISSVPSFVWNPHGIFRFKIFRSVLDLSPKDQKISFEASIPLVHNVLGNKNNWNVGRSPSDL